jgi:hypothetical protein
MSETSDIEVRRERAARNQALFRQVNERIEELSTPSYLIVAKRVPAARSPSSSTRAEGWAEQSTWSHEPFGRRQPT